MPPCGGGHTGSIRPRNRTSRLLWPAVLSLLILFLVGCAKYNTFYNAKRSYESAERVRDEAIRKHEDPPKPIGTQKSDYDNAIKKAQKVLDEYPGHSLTDDALFLQAKSYYRLESYRMSIRKFDLLFSNFPQTPYLEESLYLTALDYLLIGAVDRSQEYLDRLAKLYPDSKYQAETRKVSGDNSFAMEEWEAAAENYRGYLALDSDIEERDRVGLKLAECYWELEDYVSAAEVLQEVSNNTTSADLGFRAKLLRARVHVRMGDFEVVDLLLVELRGQAPIYRAEGEVLLVEAESLVRQDKGDEAATLVENMPVEWETPVVKARAADLLGYLYLERGDWEEARTSFQTAMLKRDELDDEDRTRRLTANLRDYLAADAALPDAPADRIAGLKLLQANAMLFGFEHPGVAADLYIQAAADTAADSTVASRALYGAYLTYDQYLDNPDSASIFARELEEKYPDSPQAFEVRSGQSSNLLGYLLAIQETEQKDRYANLTEEEKTALNQATDFSGSLAGDIRGLPGVRRRLVFLSRRPNILFEPPDRAVQSAQARQAELLEEAARGIATRDSVRTVAQEDAAAFPDSSGVLPGTGAAVTGENQADPVEEATDEAKDEKTEDEKEEDDKKKKKDDNWDFLR